MTAIDAARTLAGVIPESGKDAILQLCVDNAGAEFRAYCNRDDAPDDAQFLIAQIAVLRYNAIGAEGLQSQSFSGTSEVYQQDYPAHIKAALGRYRKAAFI
ncbi:MAG: phage head-tail connector protein [Clostridia bacterium]|nr:phage head-tail connector protein [Clostridia bacterium]